MFLNLAHLVEFKVNSKTHYILDGVMSVQNSLGDRASSNSNLKGYLNHDNFVVPFDDVLTRFSRSFSETADFQNFANQIKKLSP